MSTHNLCFRAKIRKKCIPLHYINVGCKGVKITRTCLHGEFLRVWNRVISNAKHLVTVVNANCF